MGETRPAVIDAIALEVDDCVTSFEEYKQWTRESIRPLFPHRTLASGYGHQHAGGVAIDYVVGVDHPVRHLESIRNRAGGIDTPILRRWIATSEPQLFEADRPWPDVPAPWLASFSGCGLRNCAAHGMFDQARCVGTYHSFHDIPGELGDWHAQALRRIVPVMHEMLCRVIERLRADGRFTEQLASLSSREKEMAQWVKMGKTNSEIAGLSGLSENTVKHHLTNIFGKLGVETRVQLVQRLAEHEARMAPAFGTRIV